MRKKIIIADAGPLIVFGRIQLLSLIEKLFGTIIITESVAAECLEHAHLPGAFEIKKAVRAKKIVIHQNPQNNDHSLFDFLDEGEASAISLAMKLQAKLLMDEKLGRSAAKKLNLKVIGTAGVLLLAKQNNLIKQVAPILDELKKAGYFLSDDLVQEVLVRAKEQ